MLKVHNGIEIVAFQMQRSNKHFVLIKANDDDFETRITLPVKNLRHAQIVTLAINEYEALLEEHEDE